MQGTQFPLHQPGTFVVLLVAGTRWNHGLGHGNEMLGWRMLLMEWKDAAFGMG